MIAGSVLFLLLLLHLVGLFEYDLCSMVKYESIVYNNEKSAKNGLLLLEFAGRITVQREIFHRLA